MHQTPDFSLTVPCDGYVFRSSRRFPRAPDTECFTLDDWRCDYSYRGTAAIDGATLHVWRVRHAPGQPSFRPYYVFSLNFRYAVEA